MELNNKNYFSTEAQMEFFGSSQFKSFLDCEASTMAEIRGEHFRESTSSQLVGSYVDAHFAREMPEFVVDHPEIFNSRTGELKKDFQKGEEIIERIERDPMFMEYMSGEKQKIMVGEIFGYPFKIKIDSYHPNDKIVDLKVMKDMKPVFKRGEWKSFVDAWGYDIQGFIYQQIVKYNTGKELPFFLAVATKEKPTDIGIIEIPQWRLNSAAAILRHYLPRFDGIKKGEIDPARCERCAWCKETKVLDSLIDYEDLLERE